MRLYKCLDLLSTFFTFNKQNVVNNVYVLTWIKSSKTYCQSNIYNICETITIQPKNCKSLHVCRKMWWWIFKSIPFKNSRYWYCRKNRYIDCNILNNKRKSINQMMYKLISDKMQDYKNTINQYKSIFPRVLERLH